MLTHPTHERLITLGLTGMAKALEEQRRSPDLEALSFEERVGLLVDREAAERDTKRLATRLKFAALRQSACVEDVDWRTPRGIDRAVFAKLTPSIRAMTRSVRPWCLKRRTSLIRRIDNLSAGIGLPHRLMRNP